MATCSTLPTLYREPLGLEDERLRRALDQESVRRLIKTADTQRETVLTKRAEVYHLNGISTLLFPIATPLSRPSAKFGFYRINGDEKGPRAFTLDFHGVVGPGFTTAPDNFSSVTVTSASGRNRITFRPGVFLAGGQQVIEVLQCESEDEDEDDGFWSDLGDFFGGIVDTIGEAFEWVWEKVKEISEEIWEQIKKGLAKLFIWDEDGNGKPDGYMIVKKFEF